jgi:hypothetical protein
VNNGGRVDSCLFLSVKAQFASETVLVNQFYCAIVKIKLHWHYLP